MDNPIENPSQALSNLIYDFYSAYQAEHPDLEAFKKEALLLAKQPDINLAISSSESEHFKMAENSGIFRQHLTTTVLHILIETDKNGNNLDAINKLLAVDSTLIHTLNGYGRTPIQQLMRFNRKSNFKDLAMPLARQPGSDNKALILDLLEHNHNENHDQAIGELLTRDPALLGTKNAEGESLLHIACRSGNLKWAKHFVSKGLKITDKTAVENTALHCAVCRGYQHNIALWEWLCDNGIDVNAQNRYGNTALHLILQHLGYADYMPALTWLINRADLSIQNGNNETVLQKVQRTMCDSGKLQTLLLKTEHQFQVPKALHTAIQNMHEYGETLKRQGSDKGDVAIQLAVKLTNLSTEFFTDPDHHRSLAEFTAEFNKELHSRDQQMKAYRISWSTVIKNILIACTGIGLLMIAMHLIYTQYTTGRPLFLFQQPKTTREMHIDTIEESMKKACRS